MTSQPLSGAWHLRQPGTDEWLEAHVPGGVHTDLMAAGKIADPFLGDEELRVKWVAERDWEYRRTFRPDPAVAAEKRLALVFDGLDTLAEIRLNGEPVGRADNMFRTWRWDVTGRVWPATTRSRFSSTPPSGEGPNSMRSGGSTGRRRRFPAVRTSARRPATSAGTGGRSCPTSACGRRSAWKAGPMAGSKTCTFAGSSKAAARGSRPKPRSSARPGTTSGRGARPPRPN